MKRIFALTALLCTVLVAVEVTRLMGGRPADAEEVSNDNGDVNGDGARDITDAIYLLSHLFLGGPAHSAGESCTRIVGCPDLCTP